LEAPEQTRLYIYVKLESSQMFEKKMALSVRKPLTLKVQPKLFVPVTLLFLMTMAAKLRLKLWE